MSHKGWIGVDLDRTLAHYDHWRGPGHIGKPIMPMVNLVKRWLSDGKDVRIFTARVHSDGSPRRETEALVAKIAIREFCQEHFGRELPVTCTKDFDMVLLFDDRAIHVEPNTGRVVGEWERIA